MAERPEDRRSRLVWWATIVAMVVIAAVFLLIAKPWEVPTRVLPHHARTHGTKTVVTVQ